jgi:hypothetical protein
MCKSTANKGEMKSNMCQMSEGHRKIQWSGNINGKKKMSEQRIIEIPWIPTSLRGLHNNMDVSFRDIRKNV